MGGDTVKPWVREKHERLRRYVDISSPVRKKFLPPEGTGGATYIDLYCGLATAKIEGVEEFEDASSIVAFKEARASGTAFSKVFISDTDSERVAGCQRALENIGANVATFYARADETVNNVVKRLDPKRLHFAFLDPYNLGDLSFSIIKSLAALERMDLLIHISVQDLQRNLQRYIDSAGECPLDSFAPGWRSAIDPQQKDFTIRHQILDHWRNLIRGTGLKTVEGTEEVVRGSKRQPLYWLAFAARHDRAHEFWNKIRNLSPQRSLL